jgi:hypothetical protein
MRLADSVLRPSSLTFPFTFQQVGVNYLETGTPTARRALLFHPSLAAGLLIKLD